MKNAERQKGRRKIRREEHTEILQIKSSNPRTGRGKRHPQHVGRPESGHLGA